MVPWLIRIFQNWQISQLRSRDNRAEALAYIKWFASPEVQKKWWSLGGYSCHKAVLNDPGFTKSAPFAAEFLTAMDQVVEARVVE